MGLTVAADFRCPACRGEVQAGDGRYRCVACARDYPVLHGIPDFRLRSDRYLSLDDERAKAARLAEAAERMTFAQLLDHYYTITDDVSPLLAARYRAGVLAAPRHLQALAGDVAAALSGRPGAAVLDAGCGAGGMLLALHRAGVPVVGLDIALRWLVVCRKRFDELGIAVPLVCADIEQPPFAAGRFEAVTAVDLVEHVPDVDAALGAIATLLRPAGRSWLTASNRRTLGPHPTTRIWGIGWLPRGLRAALLRRLRGVDALRFTHLLTAGELAARAERRGLLPLAARPRRIAAPDPNYPRFEQVLMRAYAACARVAPLRWLLVAVGPSFEIALRRAPAAPER